MKKSFGKILYGFVMLTWLILTIVFIKTVSSDKKTETTENVSSYQKIAGIYHYKDVD